jgi:hypothetical protein
MGWNPADMNPKSMPPQPEKRLTTSSGRELEFAIGFLCSVPCSIICAGRIPVFSREIIRLHRFDSYDQEPSLGAAMKIERECCYPRHIA